MDGLELLRAVREHDLDVPFDPHDRRARRRQRRRRRWSTARSATSSSRSTPEELEEVVARAVRLHQMAQDQARGAGDVPPGGQAPGRSGQPGGAPRARDGDAVDRVPADRVVVAPQRCSRTRRWSATRSRRCDRRPICSRRPSGWGGCRSWGAPSAIASRARWTSSRLSALLFVNLHAMELDDDSLISADAPLSRHAAARRPGGHRARAAGEDPRRHARASRSCARSATASRSTTWAPATRG